MKSPKVNHLTNVIISKKKLYLSHLSLVIRIQYIIDSTDNLDLASVNGYRVNYHIFGVVTVSNVFATRIVLVRLNLCHKKII